MTVSEAISRAHTEPDLDPLPWIRPPRRRLSGAERAALALVRDHQRDDAEISDEARCTLAEAASARRFLERVAGTPLSRWRPGDPVRPRSPVVFDLWRAPATGRVLAIEPAEGDELPDQAAPTTTSARPGKHGRGYWPGLVLDACQQARGGWVSVLALRTQLGTPDSNGSSVYKTITRLAGAGLIEVSSQGRHRLIRTPWPTGMALINSRKTHCDQGHELAGDNLRMIPGKGGRCFRRCVACFRVRNAQYERDRRARLQAQRAASA